MMRSRATRSFTSKYKVKTKVKERDCSYLILLEILRSLVLSGWMYQSMLEKLAERI